MSAGSASSGTPRLTVRGCAYWASRLRHATQEWEDAAGYDEASGRLAVADGASGSFGAGPWARALVSAWLDGPPPAGDDGVDRWLRDTASAHVAGVAPSPAPSAWYLDEAAARGAFATFAGVEVVLGDGPDGGRWRCLSIGDCCLFHLRAGQLLRSFPLERAHDFDHTPALASTVAFGDRHGDQHARWASGQAAAGDTLVLATDALATWALARGIANDEVWSLLERIDHDRFDLLASRARRRRELADDDLTMVRAVLVATG